MHKTSSMKFTLLMLLAMLFWAGGWTALKILTESVNVEVLTFWRFVVMFFAFIPILIFIKKPIKLPRRGLKYILISTILNIFFMGLSYFGVKYSTAGTGGVIITVLSPIFTFILSMLILKSTHSKLQYFGLFLGLIGGIIMININNLSSIFTHGEIYFVVAALTWAFVTLLAQKSHLHINPIHYSFFISMFSMIILFIFTLPYDLSIVFQQDTRFWIALLYLGILGQTTATTIFFIASGKLGSAKASSFMFLVPPFALLIGYIILGEDIKLNILLGGLISIVSIYFINKVKIDK